MEGLWGSKMSTQVKHATDCNMHRQSTCSGLGFKSASRVCGVFVSDDRK